MGWAHGSDYGGFPIIRIKTWVHNGSELSLLGAEKLQTEVYVWQYYLIPDPFFH